MDDFSLHKTKTFSDKEKAKTTHASQTCTTRNANRSSSGRRKMTPDGNSDL